MTLILLYLVVLVVIAAALFGVACAVFGRGETLPPLPRATTAVVLPETGVTAVDIESLRLRQVARGYHTGEVDWVLQRLAAEIESLRGRLADLDGPAVGGPSAVTPVGAAASGDTAPQL